MFRKALFTGCILLSVKGYGQGAIESGLIKTEGQARLGNYVSAYKLFSETELNAYFQVDGENNKYYKLGGAYSLMRDIKVTGGLGRADYSPKANYQLQVGFRMEFK